MSKLHELCHVFVARSEGGFSDDPRDSGGITNYGICLRFLRDYASTPVGDAHLLAIGVHFPIGPESIRRLSADQARQIMKVEFWDRLGLDDGIHEPYAMALYDCAVNCGRNAAVKIMQRGLNATGEELAVDGRLGPKTREALGETDDEVLAAQVIAACLEQRLEYYRGIVARRPANGAFLKGWENRVARLGEYIRQNWGLRL